MKKHVIAGCLAMLVIVAGTASRAVAQSTFKVDPVHSFINFKVLHLGAGEAWGRFNDPAGIVVWDEQNPANSRVEVTLQTAKIDTGNQKRDDHLRSPDFFNARQFPTITFKSNSITKKGDNEYEVSGELSLHGVTKPITATVTKVGEADTQMGHRAGWSSTFTVKRSEFGMNYMPNGLGDDVTIYVSIEGVRQ
jgi:polyisoprenoid-binding protein YceI